MTADVITLVSMVGTIGLGLGALAVAHRALRHTDRYHREALREAARATRAEARASHLRTLLDGLAPWPADPPPPPAPAPGPETVTRLMPRHLPPVAAGGQLRSVPRPLRGGERDVT